MSPAETVAGCHTLVLAAGAGTRFGGAKLLAPWRGRPLIAWAVENALAGPGESVTVVTGADHAALAAALAPLAGPRLRTVHCPGWTEGLAASLRCGLGAVPAGARAVIVALGDMPGLSPALARTALDAVLAGAPAAHPVHGGKPGHPVVLGAALLPAVAGLSGDSGARALLRGMAGVARIATDDARCLADVDTPADLARLG